MSWTRVMITAFGGPENLELETVADLPEPREGEVRVRVLVTSAAFTDVMIRKGMYPDVKEKPPFTPGYDMVGLVDAAGPGATRFRPGDRVADLTTIGACARYMLLPAPKIPVEIAASPCPSGSWQALHMCVHHLVEAAVSRSVALRPVAVLEIRGEFVVGIVSLEILHALLHR